MRAKLRTNYKAICAAYATYSKMDDLKQAIFFSFSQATALQCHLIYHYIIDILYPLKDAASDKIKEKLDGTSPCDIKFHMSFDNLPHICRDDCYRCGKRNSRPSSLKKHRGQRHTTLQSSVIITSHHSNLYSWDQRIPQDNL